MPRPYPNYCSKNGYCRNEVCTCLPEWTGIDCSDTTDETNNENTNQNINGTSSNQTITAGIAILSFNKIVLLMIIILYIY